MGRLRLMKKGKQIVTRTAVELAESFGLSASHGHRWELRSQLVTKIVEAVKKEGLTHEEVAKKVKTSRTRITSILNRNIDDVSTDLLLRILETFGYRVTLSVTRSKKTA